MFLGNESLLKGLRILEHGQPRRGDVFVSLNGINPALRRGSDESKKDKAGR